ncbi:MAG: hypothetical protein WEB51_07210 [Mycobacterium sp.]
MAAWTNAVSPWLIVAMCAAVLAAVSGLSRVLARRNWAAEVLAERADHAGQMVIPLGTLFAFLVGFAINMGWAAVGASQRAVDLHASAAQQVAWDTNTISDKAGASAVNGGLQTYLNTVVAQDLPDLARGNTSNLPSAAAYDQLQGIIHVVAYPAGAGIPEAAGIISAAQDLTAWRTSLKATAHRSVPSFLIILIAVAATALAIVMGLAAAIRSRPGLIYLWSLVAGFAVAIVLVLQSPFGAGIAVDLSPLTETAQKLQQPPG